MPVLAYILLWAAGLVAGIAGAPVYVIAFVAAAMACLAFRHEARHVIRKARAQAVLAPTPRPLPAAQVRLRPIPAVEATGPQN